MIEVMQLDFSSHLHYLWALLPETVLTIGACVLLLYEGFSGRGSSNVVRIGWGSLIVVILTAVANLVLMRFQEVGETAMVALDNYRIFTNFLFLGATALTILISLDYVKREEIEEGEFYILMLFAVVGMMLLAASRDLILIFLGFELMSVAVYVLVAFNRRDPRSAEAGLKYFLLGAFSSAFLLYGMALLFAASGTTNLGLLRLTMDMTTLGILPVIGISLIAIGFGFKVSAVPFHVWTPDAYEGAPTPVTAFLAAAIKAAAFAAFIRIFVVALGDAHDQWQWMISWMAALTMIIPNLIALVQDNLKRLLAYSSIAHAGYLLVALVSSNHSGIASFLFYMVAYTAMIIGAFAIVLNLAGKGDQRQRISDYAGLGWSRPWAAAMLALFLVSLAGLPPTAGFVGKFYILRAAIEAQYVNLAVILAVTTLVSYWYYLRVIVTMYMRPATVAPQPVSWTRPITAAVAVCAFITVLLGILPSGPLLVADKSAQDLRGAAGQVSEAPPLAQR